MTGIPGRFSTEKHRVNPEMFTVKFAESFSAVWLKTKNSNFE